MPHSLSTKKPNNCVSARVLRGIASVYSIYYDDVTSKQTSKQASKQGKQEAKHQWPDLLVSMGPWVHGAWVSTYISSLPSMQLSMQCMATGSIYQYIYAIYAWPFKITCMYCNYSHHGIQMACLWTVGGITDPRIHGWGIQQWFCLHLAAYLQNLAACLQNRNYSSLK